MNDSRMMTVRVYVRGENEVKGSYLCDWPIEGLNSLVVMIRSHGMYDGDNSYSSVITQFVTTDPEFTYFEIIGVND